MATHRIVCTQQVPFDHPATHAHIVGLGTGTESDRANRMWRLDEVLEAMRRGDQFFTKGDSSGKTAIVVQVACPHCGRPVIRSTADSVYDNNLDSLRRC